MVYGRRGVPEKDEVPPVGQEARPDVLVLMRTEFRGGRDSAADRRHTLDYIVLIACKQDDTIRVPGSASRTGCVGEDLGRAPEGFDPFELPLREEADRGAVGRPEKLQRV